MIDVAVRASQKRRRSRPSPSRRNEVMTKSRRQHALRMIMRFIMDGESFELTPELVRSRLAGPAPEEVREYWVEIGGACWPVKQALSWRRGAKRSRSVSMTARRHFERLGFPIGTESPSSDRMAGCPVGSFARRLPCGFAAGPRVVGDSGVLSLAKRGIGDAGCCRPAEAFRCYLAHQVFTASISGPMSSDPDLLHWRVDIS